MSAWDEQAVESCGEAKPRRFALSACSKRKEDAAKMRVRVRRG